MANRATAVASAVLSGQRVSEKGAEDSARYSICTSSLIRHLLSSMRILSGAQPSGSLHMNFVISSEVENGATGGERHGRLCGEGSRERVGRRTRQISYCSSEPVKDIQRKN
jgi:hypothetical protein